MWATMYSLFLFKKIISIFFCGVTIKLMDDYLDMDIDELMEQKNVFIKLESGGVPYMLLTFALACIMDLDVAVTLFFASFSLGMMGNLAAKMPSGLYGYQESIMVLFFGFYFFGIAEMSSSMLIMVTIQLLDDFQDFKRDISLKKNWAFILGRGECILLICIFGLLAIYLDWIKTIASISLMYIIVYIIHIWLSCPRVSKVQKDEVM